VIFDPAQELAEIATEPSPNIATGRGTGGATACRNGKSPGHTTRALDEANDVDTPGSMRANNADNPAIPTSQLPATRTRLYDNLPSPEERDPLSLLLVTR
jgi:hypothetical protein